ncbi:MAG: cellulase family glycosylhydrolase [Clostridia bacterium]|nr:cellulase family glycosylhydrolase [Clostridia bacterium]
MKRFFKRFFIVLGIIILSVLLLATLIIAWGHIYRKNYKFNAPATITRTDGGNTVIAEGKALYDENGNVFEIKGVNFGNLFIAEGWMTVNSVGPLLNKDGSYAKINPEGVVEEYEEIYQEEMDAILANRFTDEQIKTLNDAYFYSYCTEYDFKFIKEMGLNTIRLPMYYRNFLSTHHRYRLTDEQLISTIDFATYEFDFEKLDWFLSMAQKYDLKVIIDMHGVMGGQSGFEHCGTRDIDFWDNDGYIDFMCKLWKRIALHYKTERADLSSTILAYDLVNEPTNRNEIGTGLKQWKVMDKMYDAIREVDTEHVISIEGVWFFLSLPSPEKFGWENVLYQYHFYNWTSNITPNWMFYGFMYAQLSVSDYNVPKFVGEFNFFGDENAWMEYLNVYDQTGLGWTIWSYKTVTVGWWDSSWGVLVNKMWLLPDGDGNTVLKTDLRTATYEEILELWSSQQTDDGTNDGQYKIHSDGSLTYNVIKRYFNQDKFKTE